MQFTNFVATALALAVSASAVPQLAPTYSNTTGVAPPVNGTGTGSASPSGTGATIPSSSSSPTASFVPSTGGASQLSTGAMGLLVVGGIAMAL